MNRIDDVTPHVKATSRCRYGALRRVLGLAGIAALASTVSVPLCAVDLLAVNSVEAQGNSNFARQRSGSYFVNALMPLPDGDGDFDLENARHVQNAAFTGHLSLLYLYDPQESPVELQKFEQVIFNLPQIQYALRAFQCAQINLQEDEAALKKFGRVSPMFFAFNADGKEVGKASFRDYRARATPLVNLLEKAARGHGDIPLRRFVSEYRRFLKDHQVEQGRSRVLRGRRNRLQEKRNPPASEVRALDRERQEIDTAIEQLLELEQELLERARIPARQPKSVLLGSGTRR